MKNTEIFREVICKMTIFSFDEFFSGLQFGDEMLRAIQREFDEVEKMVRSGELQGEWTMEKIDEPGKRGYVVRGRFDLQQPTVQPNPLEPLTPWRRRPMPKRPFDIVKNVGDEVREPMFDVFDEDKAIKVYVELPGEEKNDIQLNIVRGRVEVKGKIFYKMIEIPPKEAELEKASSRYKNGVLEITIPKPEQSLEGEKRKIQID